MQLARVPMRYAAQFPNSFDELARLATESSLTTHASEQCCSACRYMTLVLAGLLHGIDRDEVLAPDWQPLVQLAELAPLHPAIAEKAAGSFRHRQPAALWAFHQAGSFEEAVLLAVNLGDNADTTVAVCGQLARVYWGESGVPQVWRDELARRDLIEAALQGIVT